MPVTSISQHPYPDHAYLERDPETNDKRWYSSKGMGVCYVHEDRAAEDIEAAVKAEREACAKIVLDLSHDPEGAYNAIRNRT